MKKFYCLILVLGLYSYSTDTPVTIATLLDEMTDREALARYPSPEYTSRLQSSYDRRSIDPDSAGWFANWDRSWFLRTEVNAGRREFVMMEADGPGAVVRFWMTFAGPDCGKGIMRIYIDDMTMPAIEGAAFDILSGGGITGAPLSESVSYTTPHENRGHNLYLPLTYAKGCKVTYESSGLDENDPGARTCENVYYNIEHRTYAAGTKVISYSAAEMDRYADKISEVQRKLARGASGYVHKGSEMDITCRLAPGGERSFDISGTKAIRGLRMALDTDNKEQALRTLVISISFDGTRTVQVPAGDFFGIGYKQLATRTWYTECTPEGEMTALWVMPFRKNCKITLQNRGDQEISLRDGKVYYGKWKWDERSMYFGAAWHQYTAIDTGAGQDMEGITPGPQDMNFVTLKGKGLYVGDAITLFNTADIWWGEGDEKIYVDGERFPSFIGTGTEDYYGYAWGRPEVFTGHPFIAQPSGDGNFTQGYTVNSRYRALDAIPFTYSLKFDMELWHWAHTRINYAPTTFWYFMPGGRAEYPAMDVSAPIALSASDIP